MSIGKALVKISFNLPKFEVGAVCLAGMASSADVAVLRNRMQCIYILNPIKAEFQLKLSEVIKTITRASVHHSLQQHL